MGQLTSLKLMVDEQGRSRGFGFVCYSAPEEASRAIQELNGKLLFGKPLYVAHAQRKDERRAQLESQFAQRAHQLRYQQMAAAGAGIYQQGPLFYQPRFNAGPAGPGAVPAGRPGFQPGMPPQAAAMMRGGRPGAPRGGYRGAALNGMPMNQGMRRPYPPQARFVPGARAPGAATSEPLTAEMLAQATPEVAKRMIGERLFFAVDAIDNQSSRKITGMLLESMDNGELLHLLESGEALQAKVAEAVQVLRAAQAKKAAAESSAAGAAQA
jgi:polyadenylate-binding protein